MALYNYLRKMLHRHDLTIHLYALCWNEERMLPHFFRHYDQLVTRYFIFDNGSTDRSIEMLKTNRKVTLRHFDVSGDSFVDAARAHYDQCWKQSRGQADWVVVCNIDEHIYHPELKKHLGALTRKGISLIIPEGYNMISDTFPGVDRPLTEIVKYGIRDPTWDKPEIFNPNKIADINFRPGRHSAAPSGEITTPVTTEVKLLHFKHLGLEYLIDRHAELRTGLRSRDIEQHWGDQYSWDEKWNSEEYQRLKSLAQLVL